MSDLIAYPTESISATAKNIRILLNNALQTHNTILNTSIQPVAHQLPGNAGSLFLDHLTTWHKNVTNAYDTLAMLADGLENGSVLMIEQDTANAHSFQKK